MPPGDAFQERLTRLGLDPADFEESFARSGGPGGQHVNKVSTAVTLRHRPSGMAVTVQDSRSQAMNRQLARERLLDAIESGRRAERQAQVSAREKTRRQNSPRPRGVKRRMVQGKRHRAGIKQGDGRRTTIRQPAIVDSANEQHPRSMKSFLPAFFVFAILWFGTAIPVQAIEKGTQKPPGTQLKPNEYTWDPDKSPTGPVGIIVDLTNQTLYVYRDGKLIGKAAVSTGIKSHPTAPGTYTILTKNVKYHSEKYHEASMPFMERLTWDGMAIHGGNNPGKPSSHGCVHVPLDFAQKLYGITQKGETVLISDLKEEPGETVNPGLVPQQTPEPAPDPQSDVKVPRGGPAPQDVSPDATPIPTPAPTASPAPAASPVG